MAAVHPELTAWGLVLWRLRRSQDQQLWCSVRDVGGELALTVHDPANDRSAVAEVHPEIVPLVHRADALKDQFVCAGWQLIDIDLDEPG